MIPSSKKGLLLACWSGVIQVILPVYGSKMDCIGRPIVSLGDVIEPDRQINFYRDQIDF